MTAPRRTQAERTAATRGALLSAARALFAAHGYGEVSTGAVVRAAGVTRGALYHHFADKTELFAAVFEHVEAEVIERVAATTAAHAESSGAGSAPDPVDLMRVAAATWLDACTDPEVHRIALIEAPAVLGWIRWREIGERYGTGLVITMLGQGIDAGRIAPQPTTPLAHVLLGALREAALYLALADDPDRARTEVGAVIDQMIRGIALDPPGRVVGNT